MTQHHKKCTRIIGVSLIALLAMLLSALLSPVFGGDRMGPMRRPDARALPKAQRETMAQQIATQASIGNFQASLEMKEHADFLLTPALLVQEALSENTVQTYPAE